MQRLEDALAEAKASQAELTRRVELFEKIAAAAGVELGNQLAPADVPRPLMAAAQDPRQDTPVHLDVAGRQFIAVVGGDGGDPHEWWAAIQHLVAQPGNRIVIHLERVALPEGLRAVACRDKRGNLIIYVSEALDAARQRAVVVEAIRASRRSEWRRGGLPSAGIVVLLGIRTALWRAAGAPKTALWRAAGALRARPVAWGAAATSAVVGASAAGVFITAVPRHAPPGSRQPGPVAVQPLTPQGQPPGHTGHQVHARAIAAPRASAGRGQAAAAERGRPTPTSSAGSSPTPTPAPSASPSPTRTQPTPGPSPSPSGGICVDVLGIRVCVG